MLLPGFVEYYADDGKVRKKGQSWQKEMPAYLGHGTTVESGLNIAMQGEMYASPTGRAGAGLDDDDGDVDDV